MRTKNPDTETVFLYPFDGRKKPFARIGLFNLAPDVYMKLSGISLHAAFQAEGVEPLFRRLQRSLESAKRESAALKAINDLLPHLPSGSQIFQDIRLALDGDADAIRRVEELSRFEAMFAGFGATPDNYGLHHWFLILSDIVGAAAARDIHYGDVTAAANRVADHPLLRELLWPEALARFQAGGSEKELTPLFVSLTIETSLAQLAAWDRQLCRKHNLSGSLFEPLFPSSRLPGRNPSSLFYDEMQRRLGAKSIGGLLASAEGSRSSIQQWTLNRWSAGSHRPELDTVRDLLEGYGRNQPHDPIALQCQAVRQVHMLGYIGQRMRTAVRRVTAGNPGALEIFWPWPAYPFGHQSFESWAAARYPHWLSVIDRFAEQLPALAAERPALRREPA